MNTAEKFACDEWLSTYPDDASYDEVIDMIHDDDERVMAWAIDATMGYEIVERIDCTRMHFEAVVDKLMTVPSEAPHA
jgi:hypothetical protein